MSTARKPRSGRPDTGGRNVTYDVRVWKIRGVDGKRARTYEVRWQVDGQEKSKSFKTRALAESFRAELLTGTQNTVRSRDRTARHDALRFYRPPPRLFGTFGVAPREGVPSWLTFRARASVTFCSRRITLGKS